MFRIFHSAYCPHLVLAVVCAAACPLLAQGTATGPFTMHDIIAGPQVIIGDAAAPVPIDLDPNGPPWFKSIMDPNGLTTGGTTVDIYETIVNVGTEPWTGFDLQSRIAELTHRAFTIAQLERGPTQVNIPRDHFYGEFEAEIPVPRPIERAAGGAQSLAAAAELLAHAKFPVLLAGGGVVMSGGSAEAVALAE